MKYVLIEVLLNFSSIMQNGYICEGLRTPYKLLTKLDSNIMPFLISELQVKDIS